MNQDVEFTGLRKLEYVKYTVLSTSLEFYSLSVDKDDLPCVFCGHWCEACLFRQQSADRL